MAKMSVISESVTSENPCIAIGFTLKSWRNLCFKIDTIIITLYNVL